MNTCSTEDAVEHNSPKLYLYPKPEGVVMTGSPFTCLSTFDSFYLPFNFCSIGRLRMDVRCGVDRKVTTLSIVQCHSIYAMSLSTKFGARFLLLASIFFNGFFKGSVERSLLSSAIFLIFTRNRPSKSKDHFCTLFFKLKCQRKDSKKAKEHRQFRCVLGRGRAAAIGRTTFHACQRCRKTAVFGAFSRLWGRHVHIRLAKV